MLGGTAADFAVGEKLEENIAIFEFPQTCVRVVLRRLQRSDICTSRYVRARCKGGDQTKCVHQRTKKRFAHVKTETKQVLLS